MCWLTWHYDMSTARHIFSRLVVKNFPLFNFVFVSFLNLHGKVMCIFLLKSCLNGWLFRFDILCSFFSCVCVKEREKFLCDMSFEKFIWFESKQEQNIYNLKMKWNEINRIKFYLLPMELIFCVSIWRIVSMGAQLKCLTVTNDGKFAKIFSQADSM